MKKISKPYSIPGPSEADERGYKQKLEADERALRTIYQAFTSYGSFCFNPYEFPVFPPMNLFDK